ncbi:response regulator [Massilia eurypsychrophila]|jgi:CheY-like chemotaxis protein|uniref:Response regulator n=1 Tax=Massilia eurypsychrophila TaxID=1485217 RepID=A0A2G8T9F4_9BURK|nr:response regulator [Massilia eurypsychrophila]PIL42603.1 response regulator [Massilia eurypsychrophila]
MLEPGKFSGLAGSVDWQRTALGDAAAWPHPLRLTLDIMFNSPLPMLLCWGREQVVLFNEAYVTLAGPGHPRAPGGNVPAMLPPPLASARGAFDLAWSGIASQQRDAHLTFIGAGAAHQRECDLFFTPISGAQQEVLGVLCALAPSAPAAAAAPTTAGLRILVVEDNLDSQYLVCEMLSAFGHDNDGVSHAEAALQKLAAGSYNVLFTDVSLPGMSGVDLARQAVAANSQLHVIFASGYGDTLLRQLEFPYRSLQKPYEIEQLQKALADVAAQLAAKAP